MNDNIYIKQIELFINYLKKLDYQDIYNLKNGLLRISFVKQRVSQKDLAIESSHYEYYIHILNSMSSRELCMEYFINNKISKKDLEGILKGLGVAYNKKDNKDKLQSKIIENTVGKKLRNKAIINK